MPWWSWLVIWVGLTVGVLGMLGVVAWRLFGKATGVLDELDALFAQLDAATANIKEVALEPSENAILVGYAEQAARREALLERRALVKELRREQRILRGKILISANPLEGKNRAR